MILNTFFFFKIIFKVHVNNIIIYSNMINNKYKMNNLFFLNFPHFSKYNWCINTAIHMKFINQNFINTFSVDNIFYKNESVFDKINNILFFKKKSILFKKNSDYEYSILHRSNVSKEDFILDPDLHINNNVLSDEDEFLSFSFNKQNTLTEFNDHDENQKIFNYKTIDFKRKINLVYKQNRLLLRKILKVKFKRQNTFNKYVKNISKLKHLDFLYNFEHKLVSLLTKSSLFFNFKDCIWFLKKGCISVNGIVVYNTKKILKPLEIVNVSYNDYFFFYYRFMLDNCLNNLYKFNTKIWKINFQRFNSKKKLEENYPSWTYKYMYYRDDIPKNLEVDFISMTMVLLNYEFNKNYIDYYNIKFLNLYLNRLYNWKFII